MGKPRSSYLTASAFSVLFNKKLLVKSQELSERGSRDGPGREGLLSSPEDTAWWEITFARCHSAT